MEARLKLEYEEDNKRQSGTSWKVVSLPTRSGEAVIQVRLWSVPSQWPT